jgi:hypothetical protein
LLACVAVTACRSSSNYSALANPASSRLKVWLSVITRVSRSRIVFGWDATVSSDSFCFASRYPSFSVST